MECDCCMETALDTVLGQYQGCLNHRCTYHVCNACIERLGPNPLCPACRRPAHYTVPPPIVPEKSPSTKAIPYGKIGAILWVYGYVLFVIMFFPSAPTCRSCALPYTSLVSHVVYGVVGGGLILCGCLFSGIVACVVQGQAIQRQQRVLYLCL